MGEEERLLLISAQRGVVEARSPIDKIHETWWLQIMSSKQKFATV